MEAFQTMSAFFVHDLKNLASTLSLMLKNLPVHFDNPAFRDDALKAVSKSGNRLNELIGCLSELRRGLEVKPVEADLGAVVASALQGLDTARPGAFVKNLQAVPRVMLDPEQVHRVITNLLLNALDRHWRHRRDPGDDGPARRLGFIVRERQWLRHQPRVSRPLLVPSLSTTKKKGMGIGMYHTKMIVEAHQGRIEVESDIAKAPRSACCFPSTSQRRRPEKDRQPWKPMKPPLLIVDDDEDIRSQMKWALMNDYEVFLAEDRVTAISAFRSSGSDVVLLDLGLPPHPADVAEGLATLNELITINSMVKVIITTGQADRRKRRPGHRRRGL